MPIIRQLVTQGGADAFKAVAIDTNIQVDGKLGWEIQRVVVRWKDFNNTIVDVPFNFEAYVNTTGAVSTMVDVDEIARAELQRYNTTGVEGYLLNPILECMLMEPRITVQPFIYCCVDTVDTGVTNDVEFLIQYETVKLSDLELMRLLQGGA